MPDAPAEQPWFRDGLPFTCTQCGHCCTGEPGYVWVTDAEVRALAASRGEKPSEFVAVYTRPAKGKRTLREKANGDCVFWEAGRGCTVYAHRPAQCRTWPFWESNVETPEDWERTVALCPGSGEGELIGIDEILARVRAVKM